MGHVTTEFEEYLFSAMHSEHCGYLHSRELLKELPRGGAVFAAENAGGIRVGEHAILFKMESHNHPCAVEPFQGAATGVGGIVRDVLAMNARPVALSSSLKLGDNKRITDGVNEGIEYYTNTINLPVVAPEVIYHPCFTENPLVNVTCIGVAKYGKVMTSNNAYPGLKLVLIGSPTAKDGVGGAAFASKEVVQDLSATQTADAQAAKRLIEATLEIFDAGLAAACQDCGAAGILSSTSEIAHKSGYGAELDLSKVHTACDIEPHEIMLSETQERMLFGVDADKIEAVAQILAHHKVPYSVIGEIIAEKRYRVKGLCDMPLERLVVPSVVPLDFTAIEQPQHQFTNVQRQFDTIEIAEARCRLGVYTFSATNAYTGLIEAAEELTSRGFTPAGLTNCLNFNNPEIAPTMHEFRRTILGIKHACEQLKIPVCSGNVSFYNKIINTPSFTLLGLQQLP